MKHFLFALCLIFFCTVIVLAQREPAPENPKEVEKPVVVDKEQKTVTKKRIREGTVFQGKRVFFRQTGNRTTLNTEENERFICLENLNLQRILKTIEEKPAQTVWKIDGEYTEFRGENYILIRRAVIAPEKTITVPPSPRLSEIFETP